MSRATEQEAYELLKKLGISFQKVDHPAITSVKNVLFSLPGPQVKNLLLKSRKGKQIYLVILPDEKHADLKELAEQLKENRLSFVSEEQLPDLLGVVPAGTVTPLALMHDKEKKIQVVIDAAIDRQDTVGFHPNINTTTLIMDFSDFEKILVYLEHLPVYENL
ncbi:TPA: prolyl-tRNA synthetase associated domain-containing protein [Enterococcus faecium]|uniref:prolyl-tRNA synthetase associated domain-containing protein n=1 Tax=Enterococcus lactis TaxID=357441 RepID=UPI00224401BB|nr:YbaK/EbsC family protein [Enterococcus lactis]MCW8065011.1 prolyl-tRNA synthetase associated domain-containing protein [Enterococcus lactis]MCW8067343.1 prolyl-tRNA synthetase associated domain-containing protein [Enterococcus lactis]